MTKHDQISPPVPLPPSPLPPVSAKDLRYIASRQKGLLLSVPIQQIAVACALLQGPNWNLLIGLLAFIAGISAAIFALMLVIKFYDVGVATFSGFLLCLLIFTPLLGLIALSALNSKATGILRANGVEVGLFGAKAKL